MKNLKYILIGLLSILFIFASCQTTLLNPNENDKDNNVVFSEFNNAEVFEGRILVGYENKDSIEEIKKALNGEVYIEIPEIKVVGIKFDGTLKEAYDKLKSLKLDGIKYVEPSFKRDLIDPKPEIIDDTITKNIDGVSEDSLWGMNKINAIDAWKVATGTNVIVAVIDTPIDAQHPDLAGQFVAGFDPVSGNLIMPDEDYDAVIGGPGDDGDDHGTHVAGTIAAKKDGNGVVGLAYGAKIMSIPIFQPDYIGDAYVARGIIWAVDNGAQVLSNSWGGGGYSKTLKLAIDYALFHNAVFVAAAGNDHTDQHWHYPSSYPGVIAVAASNARDEVTDFSNRSDTISVAAPGEKVLSTIPRHSAQIYGVYSEPYDYWAGTSMATPHVSALAALLKQLHPNATPYQIRKMIENTADDIDIAGWDHAAGYGRINAAAAVNETLPSTSGASYDFYVMSNAGAPLSNVFISLIRKSGEGANYYVTTDDGYGTFYSVDPGDYTLVLSGPDYMQFDSLNYRAEEATVLTKNITLSDESTIIYLVLDSTFKLDIALDSTITGGATLLVENINTISFETSISISEEATEFSADLSNLSGQFKLIIYRDVTKSASEITFSGIATINGNPVPVIGIIPENESKGFIEDARFVKNVPAGSIPWTIF
ncbi:S8 family serine peptidase [Marinitoga sp. 1154]|uniref:S8 family peptidase n=1 Tax=Marinitoga sp. 1154 TaxID=1643335 RepID=UPI0015865A78|nr:S8 family serine peptidase [Marinitoga sp. 1154]